jgi:dihydroxyacetone kinase-like predicted kinase
VGSEQVIVLPNGIAPRSAVAAVARRKSAQIEAVPSQSMVQGLAALAVHGPELDFDADVRAMSDAAAGTCWGSVLIDKAGRFAAKLGGKTVSCADDPPLSAASASRALIETALDGGGELVTLLIGADAEDGLGEHLCEHVAQMHPGVDVMVYHGGQAGEILQLGVE